MQQSAPAEPKDKNEYKIIGDEKINCGCRCADDAYCCFCTDRVPDAVPDAVPAANDSSL